LLIEARRGKSRRRSGIHSGANQDETRSNFLIFSMGKHFFHSLFTSIFDGKICFPILIFLFQHSEIFIFLTSMRFRPLL
jgi:hypothetical protein